jgi:hypothetical protein
VSGGAENRLELGAFPRGPTWRSIVAVRRAAAPLRSSALIAISCTSSKLCAEADEWKPSGEDQVQTHQDNETRREVLRAKRDGEAPSFPQLPSIYQVRVPRCSGGGRLFMLEATSLCSGFVRCPHSALSRKARAGQRGPSLPCGTARHGLRLRLLACMLPRDALYKRPQATLPKRG